MRPPRADGLQRSGEVAVLTGRSVRVVRVLAVVGGVLGSYIVVGSVVLDLVPDPILATAVVDLLTLGGVLALRRARAGGLEFGRPPGTRGRPRLLVPGALLAAFVAGQVASVWLYGLLGSTGYDAVTGSESSLPPVGLWTFTLVVAPVAEEALIRGLLYPLMRHHGAGAMTTIIVTSACFAALHGNLVQAVAVMPLGLLLGVVFELERRLVTVVVLHVLFNIAATFVPASLVAAIAVPPVAILAAATFCVLLWVVAGPAMGRSPSRRP